MAIASLFIILEEVKYMSDEIRATNYDCCDHVGGIGGIGGNDWLEWIIIIGVIYFLLCGNNFFDRGCCR
jgi:hypothetical protein